mgnify:CR=1 FL=1
MITTYRYKMKPTKEQEAFFIRCFGCARFVYNRALSERISAYSEKGESMSFFDNGKYKKESFHNTLVLIWAIHLRLRTIYQTSSSQ